MKAPKPDTFRDTDDEARSLARKLVAEARSGAIGLVIDGGPFVTRIALAPTEPKLLTLVSDLAAHTYALRATPDASLLVGEPGKGDPLAHPAGKLMRVGVHAFGGGGQTDVFEQGNGARLCVVRGHGQMRLDRLGDLFPAWEKRVQRRQWVLENHTYPRAANGLHLLSTKAVDALPFKMDLPT